MKQIIVDRGLVKVEEVPAPQVSERCLLVRVAYSCISSGTELMGLRESKKSILARAIEKPERILKAKDLLVKQGINKTRAVLENRIIGAGRATGYSISGTVIAVGEGVEGFKPGDRVACAGNQCAYHAEFVSVPKNLAVIAPDGMDLAEASTVALGAIAMQGIRQANPTLGEFVCVIGLGIIGQLTVQLLKANGCRVIGIDINSDRLEKAKELGMSDSIQSSECDPVERVMRLTDGYGVDAVIITAAANTDSIVKQAFNMSRQKGRVVLVGVVGLNLDRKDLYAKELDFKISCSYGPGRYDQSYENKGNDYPYGYVRWTENRNMAAYLDMVFRGNIQVKPLISDIEPIDNAEVVFERLVKDQRDSLIMLLKYSAPDIPHHIVPLRTSAIGNKKLRIALVGAGSFAKSTHLPILKDLNELYSLETIVSRDGVNALGMAKKFGAASCSTNYDEVLDDPHIDAVIITTRHNLHASMALAALHAGKHVFVEKPLALTKEELKEIESFYENESGVKPILLTGFNRRFSPIMRRVKEALNDRTNPMIINYRMNAGYQPMDSWLHSEEGGGRNIGEACHIYDVFSFLTDAKVVDIDYTEIIPQTGYYRGDDNFVCTVRYSDGSVCTLTYTALGSRDYSKEQMDIFCDGWVGSMIDYRELRFTGLKMQGIKSRTINKGHHEEIKAFADAIINDSGWPIPLWQMVQSTIVSFSRNK